MSMGAQSFRSLVGLVAAVARAWRIVAFLLVVASALAGCTTYGQIVAISARFDPQAAAYINATGKADIRGQAFVRRNDGKLLRAVGTDIQLIPRTAYADERMAAIYGNGNKQKPGVRVPEADPDYLAHMRQTVARSSGSFAFEDVADGEYYVVAMVHLPSDHSKIEFPIMERVTVTNGKSVYVVMRGY
jgi:xanthine/CO dehydrogenase XdhC/CoxF family maturation factor